MQEIYLQCLYQNYSEKEINEIIKLSVDTYRASDKGDKNWLETVKYQIELKNLKLEWSKSEPKKL